MSSNKPTPGQGDYYSYSDSTESTSEEAQQQPQSEGIYKIYTCPS